MSSDPKYRTDQGEQQQQFDVSSRSHVNSGSADFVTASSSLSLRQIRLHECLNQIVERKSNLARVP
jgi:hypothetical protein